MLLYGLIRMFMQLIALLKKGINFLKTDWKIVSFTTEEASGEGSNNGHAKHLIDGNVETFWHSRWQGGSDPLPYEIIIDMNIGSK